MFVSKAIVFAVIGYMLISAAMDAMNLWEKRQEKKKQDKQ